VVVGVVVAGVDRVVTVEEEEGRWQRWQRRWVVVVVRRCEKLNFVENEYSQVT
jgi:hypothetical protein